jgi:hypothetical protein
MGVVVIKMRLYCAKFSVDMRVATSIRRGWLRLTRPTDRPTRTGVHIGECEMRGEKVSGLAVHTAARVMAAAGDDEILVSSALWEAAGSGEVRVADRGVHELKGVPGEWRLFRVERTRSTAAKRTPPSLGGRFPSAPQPIKVRSRADAFDPDGWMLRAGCRCPARNGHNTPRVAEGTSEPSGSVRRGITCTVPNIVARGQRRLRPCGRRLAADERRRAELPPATGRTHLYMRQVVSVCGNECTPWLICCWSGQAAGRRLVRWGEGPKVYVSAF